MDKKLYTSLKSAFNAFGTSLLAEERLINVLSDYRAFSDNATKRVFKILSQTGYLTKLHNLAVEDKIDKFLKRDNLISEAIHDEGLQAPYVKEIFDCLSAVLGWIPTPQFEEKEDIATTSFGRTFICKGVPFKMVFIKGGTFFIGATAEQGIYAAFNEKPAVEIKLSDYYICETLVTQELWNAVMPDNPSHFKGPQLPVERVSWEDCQDFLSRLSIIVGVKFRLPTEAEWEYAARGGSASSQTMYAGTDKSRLSDFAWYKDNSNTQSHDVKTALPNELGIYDMCGNVAEWCSDWYFNTYTPDGRHQDPQGPANGVAKVYRGGSWDDKAINVRISKRFSMNPIYKNKLVGLRLVATL